MEEPMDCAQAQARMTEQISTRLGQVQAELDAVFAEQAAAGGVGAADTGPLRRSIPLAQEGGRLRAAADVLTAPPEPGGCTDECTCSRAAAVTGGAYVFTPGAVTPQGRPIVCTLDGDGGDMAGRIGEWQAVLAQAAGHQ